MPIKIIDTHSHLDGEEFDTDRAETILRAQKNGVDKVFVPAIDYASSVRSLDLAKSYPNYIYAMAGLHPEEVKDNWREELENIKKLIKSFITNNKVQKGTPFIAIGEVGLDYYWTREFEKEQLSAFEEQVRWSVEWQIPLMIHCRKGQNEMVKLLRRYEDQLPGGVFHCFTGNEQEAAELLSFQNFMLGIGGVLTFKKSHLPEVLPKTVPLSRIVLETDSPYMAPVPMRGKRNESSFVVYVLQKLAETYGVEPEVIARTTNENVRKVFTLD